MNCVNMFALFVEVVAALIEMPISHHGMDLPERKKSFASDPARREHQSAMPITIAKNATMADQSQKLKVTSKFM